MALAEDDFSDDVVPRRLVLRLLGAAIALSIFLGAIAALFLQWDEGRFRPSHHFDERDLPAPHSVAAERATPYQVPDPPRDPRRALLDGYGWIDRDRGLARIPVEKAVELLLREAR